MSRLADRGELSIVEEIRRRFAAQGNQTVIGIGDDAAAISCDSETLLLSTDTMVEGVHFDTRLFTPYQIGYKLIAVNVSDIFAMAGLPRWALLNLTLPSELREEFLQEFLQGLSKALSEYGLSLIGGDITSSQKDLTFTLTIIGSAEGRVIKRDGARPGERLYVSGPLGEAACGLRLLKSLGHPVALERGETLPLLLPWQYAREVLERFLLPAVRPLPNNNREYVTAMLDISDGLWLDLYRLCQESGVGVRVYEERLPVSEALREVSAFLKLEPIEMVVSGGEDYHLLFTAKQPIPGMYEIGEITERGLYFVRKDGTEEEIKPAGYQHFVS